MPASTLLRAESRTFAPFWPLLCSAVRVGIMLASETVREYRGAGKPAPSAGPLVLTSLNSPNTSAHQPGRGRHAETPWQIPWKGWKDIVWRTYEQIGEDRLLAVAAGVVFYGLLAVFPAVTAFVSLYGLFASASAVSDHLSMAAGILPEGAESCGRARGATAYIRQRGPTASFGLGVILYGHESLQYLID